MQCAEERKAQTSQTPQTRASNRTGVAQHFPESKPGSVQTSHPGTRPGLKIVGEYWENKGLI